jgi:integrase
MRNTGPCTRNLFLAGAPSTLSGPLCEEDIPQTRTCTADLFLLGRSSDPARTGQGTVQSVDFDTTDRPARWKSVLGPARCAERAIGPARKLSSALSDCAECQAIHSRACTVPLFSALCAGFGRGDNRMTNKRGHGDGGIDEPYPGHYRLRWRVDGRRYSKMFRGSLAEAKKELRRLLKTADDGEHVAPDKLILATWIERWVALLRRGGDTRKSGLVNARTLERYEELLRLHVVPTLGTRPVQRIAATEIDALYNHLEQRLSTRTVHHIHTVLGACLNAAVRKGLLVVSPVAKAEAPVPCDGQAGQVLDQDQLTSLLNGFRGSTLYPIVAVAAFTGARRNEILSLRWSDFKATQSTLTIARSLEETRAHGRRFKEPKTARGHRTIAIDDGLVALLSAGREKHLRLAAGIVDGAEVDLSLIRLPEGALIFPAPPADGEGFDFTRPRDARNITKVFSRRAAKLGFPKLRFHDLRGTHETMLLDAGVPVHVVAARCGHDAAILLRTYARRTKKADTRAASIIGTLSERALGGS